MHDTPQHDPCDDLLAPPPRADGREPLRQDLLRRTTRLLRRRRLLRAAAVALALAACYAAGLLTMRLAAPPRAAAEPTAVADRPDPLPPPIERAERLAAPAVEDRAARADDAERSGLYRSAGDRYLEQNDHESALRCYTRSLDAASADDARFSPDDNWLLMAIKDAREKERRHANGG
jgi:hypothetical protein